MNDTVDKPTSTVDKLTNLEKMASIFRYAVLPIVGVLIWAVIWVHDTSATVKDLKNKDESRDATLTRIENKVDVLNGKFDLFLQEFNAHPVK